MWFYLCGVGEVGGNAGLTSVVINPTCSCKTYLCFSMQNIVFQQKPTHTLKILGLLQLVYFWLKYIVLYFYMHM